MEATVAAEFPADEVEDWLVAIAEGNDVDANDDLVPFRAYTCP
jgi:hypothetical protein